MPGNVTQIAASSSPMSIPSSSASVATTPSSSPGAEPALDLVALGRRVAGAIGSDPLGELGVEPVDARGAGSARRPCATS